jgi:uncharacterized membrane protein YgcG
MHSLSRDERLRYDRRSEAILGETLAAFAQFDSTRLDPTEWKFLARRGQITVHRALSATRQGVDSHKRRLLANGFLNTGLNDALGGLYAEDDQELLTTQAIVRPSGTTAVDAAVLAIIERRQPRAAPFRFAGVRWYNWKKNVNVASPTLSIGEGQECDLLTYERTGTALAEESDKEGSQELAYYVMLSMNKPEWPLGVARGPGLRRADMAFCFLFRKVCDDLVECFALADYDCRTSASSRRAADTEMADIVLMVTRLPDCAQAKTLSGFVRKAKGRPVLMSKTCLRCGSKKKVLDPLRNCCICKKSVCRQCSELKTIFLMNSRTHEPETDAFCSKCLARIDILTAKKNAQHNTSTSASGGSSTGGSSKERDSHSGGSSGGGSKSGFKFWKKSKDKKTSSPRAEKETRRHSLPATMDSRDASHTPNYDALFQNYDVFGRASDDPRRRHFDEHEASLLDAEVGLADEQEPEKEQDGVEPGREKRWRQTTFLANPEAAAAEAAAHRMSLPLRQRAPLPVVREREYTVAEVYPLAKTVLETEGVSDEDSGDSPHSEAERAHLLYLERKQRLEEEKDRPHFCRREVLATRSPVQESSALTKDKLPAATSGPSTTGGSNRQLRSKSVPAQHAERKPAASVSRRSESSRGQLQSRPQDNDDTFRMDLYGRF